MFYIFSRVKKAAAEGGAGLVLKRAGTKARSLLFGNSVSHLFIHQLNGRYPAVQIHVDEFEPTQGDIAIAGRIMAAFAKAVEDEKKYRNGDIKDLWDMVRQQEYGDFFDIYNSNDLRRMAKYLANMHRHSLSRGISDFNIEEYRAANQRDRRDNTLIIKDKMVALAEAVGVLNVEDVRDNMHTDSAKLVEDTARAMGIDILPPNIDGGIVKIKLGNGYFSARDIYSLYTAWRIDTLMEGSKEAVCEIGAGMGKVALYANRFGFKDYSIFDLPITNIAQSWYLIKSGLPVALYGEDKKDHEAVKILPYWEFDTNKTYGVTLNADSFPEIGEDIVAEYLKKIRRNTTKYFLSINQERFDPYGPKDKGLRELVVRQLTEKVGGYKRIYRFPFWLRRGYVEELYAPGPLATSKTLGH